MGRKTYAVLAVAGVVVALLPLILYLSVALLPRGDGRRVYEENIIGVRFYAEDYFAKLSPREYVITQPMSWAAHTYLTWNGYGDFKFTFPAYEPDRNVMHSYFGTGMNCTATQELYWRRLRDEFYEVYDFLLEHDCFRLRRFLFDTESRSWYASLTLVGYLKRLYMESVREPYFIWIMVHFDSDVLRVKFYNVVSEEELDELKKDLRSVLREHPRVLVGIIEKYPTWYKLFEEMSRNRTYIVALYARDSKDVDVEYYMGRVLPEILSAIHRSLADIEFYDYFWVLVENREISRVYCDSPRLCEVLLRRGIHCVYKYEYFTPRSFI